MTDAPGATPSMPFPLPASAAMMPVTCVPWPFWSCGVSSFSTKSWPGTSRPARSSCEASTPVSSTATTAPEPVLVECAASASIMSRPHCCERSGSAAPNAAVAPARQTVSERSNASGVRMRRLSPDPRLSSPIACPPMNDLVGATWKLRAIVYGLLAAIAVLVLVARPSSNAEPVANPLVTLRGRTAQGSPIWVGVQNGHVRNLYVTRVKGKCGRPVSWQHVVGVGSGAYSEENPWI